MQENMWQAFCGKYVKVGVFLTEINFLAVRPLFMAYYKEVQCTVVSETKRSDSGGYMGGIWRNEKRYEEKRNCAFSDLSVGHVPFAWRLYQQIREEGAGILSSLVSVR